MEILVGYFAALFTTISFLPQVIRVVVTRQTRDISRNMYILQGLGILLWLIYGITLANLPIILANIVTLVFVSIILYYKLTSKEDKEQI